MKAQHFFATHPLFTHAEFIKLINENKKLSTRTTEATLRHYCDTERLARLRKGLYVVLPGEEILSKMLSSILFF